MKIEYTRADGKYVEYYIPAIPRVIFTSSPFTKTCNKIKKTIEKYRKGPSW